MSQELVLTTANFEKEVLQASQPVLVDFWATWCGPCRMMGPIVEELAREMENLVVGKLNVDEASEIAQQYNILSIPTFVLFKNGQVVDQFSGAMSKEMLRARVEKQLA
ncbi:MAG TPA: thioredoxin [Patescibacteria group bacterium]|nr:thioredoxin [Patescibacteria group bacterium]